jgi:hypothetical protein
MDLIAMLVFGYMCLVIGLALGVVAGVRIEQDNQSERMKQVAEKMAENPEVVLIHSRRGAYHPAPPMSLPLAPPPIPTRSGVPDHSA